ncbi:MAG: polysaccharide pyruvyl transferase family protein [Candidatus Methanomethylophilaceae archaeon]|nr:polysaccharide pyruvyl transferase family protein [Candidatus Methanomethylophilaceae archaeon]
MGKEVVMIEDRGDYPGCPPDPVLMEGAYVPGSAMAWCRTPEEQAAASTMVYNLVAGPGPIWDRRLIGQGTAECYSLDFAPSWRSKMAVASSFGSKVYFGSEDEYRRLAGILRRLDRISVCDQNSKRMLENKGMEAKVILDPIFLCDQSVFEDLVESSTADYPNWYVLSYALRPENLEGAEKLYDAVGMGVVNVCTSLFDSKNAVGGPVTQVYTVANWIKSIRESSFVLTDSYHAAAFAILFRKPFAVITRGALGGGGRIDTMLSMLGLSDRLFDSIDQAAESPVLDQDIDYDSVEAILEEKRRESVEWMLDGMV